MGFWDDLGGKFKDATGNVAKAYLCVRDVRGKQEDEQDLNNFYKDSEEVQKSILKEAAKKISPGTDFEEGEDGIGGDVMAEQMLKRGARGDSSSAKGLSFDELADLMSGRYIPVQVQYNPSSIKFTSDLGGRRRINPVETVGQKGDSQLIKNIPKNTELSCNLIFEKINVNDAFIQASEGWNASIGNVTSTVGSAVKKLSGSSGSEPYSVRKEVEGFLSLVSTMYTRDVIFYFGKMCFHGELTSVNATYKMFNKNGDPIHAEVEIKIRQSSQNQYDQSRWVVSFDTLFKEKENDDLPEDASTWDKVKHGAGKGFDQLEKAFTGGIF